MVERSPRAGRAAAADAVEPVPVSSEASIPNVRFALARAVPVRYLRAGKAYAITEATDDGFNIVCENGSFIYCFWHGCAHLAGGDWVPLASDPRPGGDA